MRGEEGVRRRGFAALESGGAASPRWSQEARLRRGGARRRGFAALEPGGAASPRWSQEARLRRGGVRRVLYYGGMDDSRVQVIDHGLFDALIERARSSPRLRTNHNFHGS